MFLVKMLSSACKNSKIPNVLPKKEIGLRVKIGFFLIGLINMDQQNGQNVLNLLKVDVESNAERDGLTYLILWLKRVIGQQKSKN